MNPGTRGSYIVLGLNVAWGQFVLQTWMVTGSGQCLAAFLICSAAALTAVNKLTRSPR